MKAFNALNEKIECTPFWAWKIPFKCAFRQNQAVYLIL